MIKRFSLLALVCLFLITSGAFCGSSSSLPAPKKVTLTIWRSEDSANDFDAITKAYSALYPHVHFDIQTFTPEEYEDALFKAWAKGQGPDIFSVPNWRLGKFKDFISPMPAVANLKTTHIEKSFGKQTLVVDPKTTVFPTVAQLQDRFIDVVPSDVVMDSKIYGLPLSVDTLGLYYNREIMAKAQVAVPPTTWDEFAQDVQAMTVRDDKKNIVRPAAALGTAKNIPYFFDILSTIMMQHGTPMADGGNQPTFANDVEHQVPGAQALDFYLKFSSPKWQTYTWNDDQLSALEAFTQGSLGFYFGYHSDLAAITQQAPTMNFSYTKLPQFDTGSPVNYARYSVETVHVNSPNADYAWDFINFAASQKHVTDFLDSTGRVPALRALVGAAQEDPAIGVFDQQALTAKSWYHGTDPDAAVLAFTELVNDGISGKDTLQNSLNLAQEKVHLTIR